MPPCLLLLQLKFTDYWLQQRTRLLEPPVALLDRPNCRSWELLVCHNIRLIDPVVASIVILGS
jgi:hypothetical protein